MTRRRVGSDLQAVERSITRDGVMTESLYWWFVERHLVRSMMQNIVDDDRRIVQEARRIIQGARRTLEHVRATREAVALQRRSSDGGLTEVMCAFCRKSASEAEVREGEKLFHLDCYLLFKRQKPLIVTRHPRKSTDGASQPKRIEFHHPLHACRLGSLLSLQKRRLGARDMLANRAFA
jgi:hypothetical protein